MEREVFILYQKEISSIELSEKLHLMLVGLNGTYVVEQKLMEWVTRMHVKNNIEFLRMNRRLWLSMSMDCYRHLWMHQLRASQAHTKHVYLLESVYLLADKFEDLAVWSPEYKIHDWANKTFQMWDQNRDHPEQFFYWKLSDLMKRMKDFIGEAHDIRARQASFQSKQYLKYF